MTASETILAEHMLREDLLRNHKHLLGTVPAIT